MNVRECVLVWPCGQGLRLTIQDREFSSVGVFHLQCHAHQLNSGRVVLHYCIAS